jgi:fructose-specific component phosphotransferase system IIB-like protein
MNQRHFIAKTLISAAARDGQLEMTKRLLEKHASEIGLFGEKI